MASNTVQYPAQPLLEGQTQVYAIAAASQKFGRHKISVSVFELDGTPVPSGATGTLSGKARGIGADQFEDFINTASITADERAFVPILDNLDEIELSVTGLGGTQFLLVTITSSGDSI